MSAVLVVADALAEIMPESDVGQDGSLNIERARHILAALSRARLVVEPAPLGATHEGQRS